jgi:hypothetical protein
MYNLQFRKSYLQNSSAFEQGLDPVSVHLPIKEKSLCDFRPENCRFFNCMAQELVPAHESQCTISRYSNSENRICKISCTFEQCLDPVSVNLPIKGKKSV